MAAEDVVATGLCGVVEKALIASGVPPITAKILSQRACHPTVSKTVGKGKRKVKKTVSKYNKRLGIELKKLKKKHPKTAISKLMKRAHAATKRALK